MPDVVTLCFKKSVSLLSATYTYDVYTGLLMSEDMNLYIGAYVYTKKIHVYMFAVIFFFMPSH